MTSFSPRVAVVGCVSRSPLYSDICTDAFTQGHGSLNEIYAEVDRQAAARGWSGVDVVVVGGDFQVSLLSLCLARMSLN